MNSLTTNQGIVHKTSAEVSAARTMAKAECGNRKIAGWVTAEKSEVEIWERFCPKCSQ